MGEMLTIARTLAAIALAAAPLVPSSALAATPASSPAAPVASTPAAFHYGAPLASGRIVRLDGIDVAIDATPSDDGKVDVRAVVREGDASRLRVVTREEEGGVAVCVLHVDESPEGCRVDGVTHASHHGGHDREPRVDLVARLPRGVRLLASSISGAVRARDLTGDVRVSTVSGDVAVSTRGVAEVTTVSGAIDASFGTAPRGNVAFTSTSGVVAVTFPAGTDADVEAMTVSGTLNAAFPMEIRSVPGDFGPKSGHARLGHGGARVRVQSVSGAIDLRLH